MAFTVQDLDAIDRAIASGELTVKCQGREVTYRSIGELQAARETILRSLRAATAPSGGIGFSVARFD